MNTTRELAGHVCVDGTNERREGSASSGCATCYDITRTKDSALYGIVTFTSYLATRIVPRRCYCGPSPPGRLRKV